MTTAVPAPGPGPGWYRSPTNPNVLQWWDGTQWGPLAPPQQQTPQTPLLVQPNVRQAMDRSQYVRPQQGHSLVKHLLFGWILAYIPTIYYAISPNHYFHT